VNPLLIPTGSVTFSDSLSGFSATTVSVDGTGVATFTTSFSSVGTHTISATFTDPDGNFTSGTATKSVGITPAVGSSTISVESRDDGLGCMIADGNVNCPVVLRSGKSRQMYAIERDSNGDFVANVAPTWTLVEKTGGVVDADLVIAADGKSATLFGRVVGT